jgi:hypothetical protein
MEKNMSLIFLWVLTVFVVLFASPAYAYLDIGSTSMVLQMILAALVGAAISIKMYWQKLCEFVRNLFSSSKPRDDK